MDGWISLHRKILKSSIFHNEKYLKVWLWCLLKATHDKYKFPFNNHDIILMPGQFITGQKSASKTLGCSVQSYKSALRYLKSTNRITTTATNKFSVITVVNWGQYQITEHELTRGKKDKLTNQQPTSNQPATTYNNNNNIKKRAFYGNIPLRKSNGKWWDISEGTGNWREYVDSESKITWK